MAASAWAKSGRELTRRQETRVSWGVEFSRVWIGAISSPELVGSQELVGFPNLEVSLDFIPYRRTLRQSNHKCESHLLPKLAGA